VSATRVGLFASYRRGQSFFERLVTVTVTVTASPTVAIGMPSVEIPEDSDSRLLLVSNRLPITIKRSDDGKYDFSMSSGGLVSGLSGLSKLTTFRWYGWPGLEVPDDEIPTVTKRLEEEYGAFPVFINDELADRHYNGFSSQYLPSFYSFIYSYVTTSIKSLSVWLTVLSLVFLPLNRFHPLATFSLPSRRNHI
jgi:hypothetical protein